LVAASGANVLAIAKSLGADCKKVSKTLRVASFFSGIGGFDLGFQRARCQIVYQCEIDEFCSDVLQHHWPKVPRTKDITAISYEGIPKAEIWCAGFPCQDVSLARARPRDGLKGKRTGLFYNFAETLGKALPSIVVLENVPGLLTSHEGRDFAIVIQTLVELGYGVAWRVFNSKFFGLPQSRERVFIVGCRRNPKRAAKILFEPERGRGHLETSSQPKTKTVSPFRERAVETRRPEGIPELNGHTPIVPKLAFCLAATSGRHTGTDWSRTYIAYEKDARRLTPGECESLQGFPRDWTVPHKFKADSEEIDSLRYSALGNAVSVPVAEWLGSRIVATQPLVGHSSIVAS
jgi:DNA (cytosine-5)-methyltransferase 1